MPTLNRPQAKFLALPHKFRAYVAGYRAGKTWAIGAAACEHFWKYPRVNRGYFAPTYAQIRDIYYPTIEEVGFDWGLRVKVNEANKEVHFYSGRRSRGTVICRSMEKPDRIVGFKIGEADVDEIDTLPERHAERAWRKIIARLSVDYDGRRGVNVATTPEGFRFTYSQFVKAVRDKPELAKLYGLVQASTYENEANLPADYIPSLLASYPEQLILAYLRGQFVNLTSGTVYHDFDRTLNNCFDKVEAGEAVHVGMDFNVGHMAAITHVLRDALPRAVDEIIDGRDTPDMIRRLKERYWEHDGNDWRKTREVRIYPDASGGSRKSVNASETDIALLKAAGFKVDAPAANPPVKDRVNSMNAMFRNAKGERRYMVNVLACPTYADNLEQQNWVNGEPDKANGTDHTNDAGGYFIHRKFPLKSRKFTSEELRA